MKKLHGNWKGSVEFVDVLVRQAHPGTPAPPYGDTGQKMRDALAYQTEEDIPWTVLADGLEGSVHRGYGGLPHPSYLIGADGRVAYYSMWTSVPALYEAGEQLMRQGGRGVVHGGRNKMPQMLPIVTDGWRALERGRPGSVADLFKAAPPAPALLWIGSRLRPLLAPLASRAKPIPRAAKFAIAIGAGWTVGRMLGARR